MYIMKTMSDTVPQLERHIEQNNDWVLRDLYAYDKIDMYDIATYEIITNAIHLI